MKRIRPGTKREDLYKDWPGVYEQEDVYPGMYHLQEYIQENCRKDITVKQMLTQNEEHRVDDLFWISENMRQIYLELTELILKIDHEIRKVKKIEYEKFEIGKEEYFPPGKNEGSVHPMDYMRITLDNAVSMINNPKLFSVRKPQRNAEKMLKTHTKRVYRIFAWCFYNCKDTLLRFEKKRHSVERFLALIIEFHLLAIGKGEEDQTLKGYEERFVSFEREFFTEIGCLEKLDLYENLE